MSRFLYKYMSLRSDYFKIPMIRATPAHFLNDPFEGHFNKRQVLDADRNHGGYYQSQGKAIAEAEDMDIDGQMGVIQEEISDLGILSFTEDFNNPLMWAHYADEHRGMVVEFDFNEPFFEDSILEVDGRRSRFGKSYLSDFYEFPEKVDYRRTMPSFERVELSAPDSMEEFHWGKFYRAILFTKGNDWIYEKEQRSIVRLRDADSIICDDSEIIRRTCDQDKRIDKKTTREGKLEIIYPNEYEMQEDMGDESLKSEIYRLALSSKEAPIHLFRINPKAISSVYFGCKSRPAEAVNDIKNNLALEHLKNIHRMRPSDSEYQLTAIRS